MLNEANTVEAFLRDQLSGGIQQAAAPPGFARKSRSLLGAGWYYLAPKIYPATPTTFSSKLIDLN